MFYKICVDLRMGKKIILFAIVEKSVVFMCLYRYVCLLWGRNTYLLLIYYSLTSYVHFS